MDRRRTIGSSLLFVAGGIFGKETLIWAWNKALDGAAGLFSGMPPMTDFGPFPWWNAAGLVLMTAGAFMLVQGYRSRKKTISPEPIVDDERKPSAELAPFPCGLYVGQIEVGASQLETERLIKFHVYVFNATGEVLIINSAAGTVHYCADWTEAARLGLPLPPVTLAQDETVSQRIENLSERIVIIEQRLPRQQAEQASAQLLAGKMIAFYFLELNVMAHVEGDARKVARLPIWDGVTLGKHPDQLRTGRAQDLWAQGFQ